MQKIAAPLVSLITAVALAACGAPAAQSPAAPAAEQQPAAPAAEQQPAAPAAEQQPAADGDPSEIIGRALDPELTAAALDELGSYRLSTQSTQKAGSGDQLNENITGYLEERGAGSAGLRIVVTGNTDAERVETYISEGAVYQVRNQSGAPICEASGTDAASMTTSIDMSRSMLSMGLISAASAPAVLVSRGEMINGVSADHYRVSQEDPTMLIEGDIWIAPAGYLVMAETRTEFRDPSSQSTLEQRFSYSLSAIGEVPAIELPEICAAAGGGA